MVQRRRRVSDTVLSTLLPGGIRKNSSNNQFSAHTGLVSSGTTTNSSGSSSPVPWAVFNFDVFWVLLSPNSQCSSCGRRASTHSRKNSLCRGPGVKNGYPPGCTSGACHGARRRASRACNPLHCQPGGGEGCCCNRSNSHEQPSTVPECGCTAAAECNRCSSSAGERHRRLGVVDAAPPSPSPFALNHHHHHHHHLDHANIPSSSHASCPNPDSQAANSGVASPCVSPSSLPTSPLFPSPPCSPPPASSSPSFPPCSPSSSFSSSCGHPACGPSSCRPFFHLAKAGEARQLRAGDLTHREGTQLAGATMKLSGEGFSAHKSAVSEQQQRQTVTPVGSINQETMRQSASSGLTINAKGVCTKQSSSMSSSQSNVSIVGFDDLGILSQTSQPGDVQKAIMKYSGVMSSFVEQLSSLSPSDAPTLLENINEMMRKAWSVPTHGQRVGSSLCNVLRDNGGLDILIDNCMSNDDKLKFSTAKVLEQCLTTDNRGYVVENGLKNVVNVACDCTKYDSSVDGARVGTGILEHLFKHNERTCSDIIKLGGLDAVLYECRKKDVETLRHCAGALANLSLYGGTDNHQAMIQQKVPVWLFPLAFHTDDNIKYYAFLAIAALVANKEIEAAVLKSETLNLVEPFVTTHLPDDFANSNVAHRHGQSPSWLQRLVPVLNSKREEARNLAAFHFCMEAGIKKRQGNIEIFHDIGAIEPLKDVASSPNAISSKYAAQALRLIGEEVPHKLSQQVPLWSVEDVSEWVKQIGFSQFMDAFLGSRVDGDLLLQLNELHLQNDIGITNGILRRRFLRELRKLKMIADYSSCDSSGLNTFLTQIDTVFAEYTYKMIEAGVSKELLRYLTDDQLLNECGIFNSIHRQKVQESIRNEGGALQDTNVVDKNLDVFISYRRSNGSQLASLLKVHLQLKLFSVFIDVERLEAGKFDNNLLNSIRQAKNFILVLTPNALDRCIGDTECKDWVHREIVAALQSGCEIIPIIDNFQWPEPEQLPEDMRAVCTFNGVRWIHDYQDACVEKLERFMRGEGNVRGDGPLGRHAGVGGMATPGTPSTLVKAPHVYQRTTSTESGKGSACSDKDFAKD